MSIDKEELKEKIKEIIELVDELPEKYSEKAFEVLLTNELLKKSIDREQFEKVPSEKPITDDSDQFIIPIEVRALFHQYDLDESILGDLFIIDKNTIFPVYKLKTVRKAIAQIQVSLLMALENALKSNGFIFDIERVRTKCQELKVYDGSNFKSIFSRNSDLFKSLDEIEIELSPDGKNELVEVIREIILNE